MAVVTKNVISQIFQILYNSNSILAFGCRQGLVYIVSLSGKGKQLQKIRAHDEDIQGIDWSPIDVHDLLSNDGDKFDLPLGMISHKKSLITIFVHNNKIKNFYQKV